MLILIRVCNTRMWRLTRGMSTAFGKDDTAMTNDKEATEVRQTAIGGQAVLEGLMMMGPEKVALAVRRPDDSIALEYLLHDQPASRMAGIPVMRGGVRLLRQLLLGVRALMRSADLLEEEDTDADAQPPPRDNPLVMYGTVALGVLLGVGLFILLPNLLTSLLHRLLPGTLGVGFGGTVLKNLLEGLLRIALFIGYVALTSRQKDISRVWMYHGAEHKTIACYEHDLPLTVENVRAFSPHHPRCGTSFLFVVMLVSILLFSFAGWHAAWLNLVIRLALVPLVAGLSYELIRWAGSHENLLSRLVSLPGLAMQRLTAKQPDDEMIEVAIAAMQAVIPQSEGPDTW